MVLLLIYGGIKLRIKLNHASKRGHFFHLRVDFFVIMIRRNLT